MDPNDLDSLLAMQQQEYWQHPMLRENQSVQTLQALGGGLDALGLQVPDFNPGQAEFNRLSTGSALSQPQQRYIATRQAAQSARANNQDASFERTRVSMRPLEEDGLDLNPYPRGPEPMSRQTAPVMRMAPTTVQGTFNAKHGQAIAFAKALGFGQQIAASPQNAELAFQAMTMMLRRVPLPVLLSPKRKPQTAAEFQALLEQLSKPTTQTSKFPVQPT